MPTINVSRFRKSVMLYALILLVIADFFLILALMPDIFNGYTIYPFLLNFGALRFQFACIVIPVSMGIIFIAALFWKMEHAIHPIIIVALLAANVIACCARSVGFAVVQREQASILYDNHFYNALSAEASFGGSNDMWVRLYECDQYKFFCRKIYDKYALTTDATLIPDPAAHTVTLAINGEAVYMHEVN